METRANHALIGAFTLAVIASAFAFVYWFSGGDKPTGRQTYRIVFTGSVSGLARGGSVLFNGVRIGEVTMVDLAPEDPSHAYALIEVGARVPVRTDTKARLEYAGLTQVAAVSLTGGSGEAAPLGKSADGGPGVIFADRSDFQDIIESARRIAGQASDFLDKGNRLLEQNAGSITASVKNVEKFSDALAANSAGVKDFMGAMADIGRTIKPLTAKLETLVGDADNVVKAIDPKEVSAIVHDLAELSAKLNAAGDKVDKVLTNLNGFLATSDSKGVFGEVADAAKSIRKLADNLDIRTKEMTVNINRFAGTGLRQYEALAVDGRKTLEEINQAIRSIESNPQQFLFGKKQTIPEYSSSR